MQVRITQYKLAQTGCGSVFAKYDTTNAFGSISTAALDQGVRNRRFTPWDEALLEGRHRRNFVVLEAPNVDWMLLKLGTGCKPGDTSAARLFADSFLPTVKKWKGEGLQTAKRMRTRPLNIQNEYNNTAFQLDTFVMAGDLARLSTCTSAQEFQQLTDEWDNSLGRNFRQTELVQNPSKRFFVVVTPTGFWDGCPPIRNKVSLNFSKVVPEVKYMGGIINHRGDLSTEVKERIEHARRAWISFGSFWTRKTISFKFRRTVFLSLVRSTLLAGLEAMVITVQQYTQLEKFQMKCVRALLCGEACIKFSGESATGEQITTYRAKTNDAVRLRANVNTIRSEMTARRLRWLQSLVEKSRDGPTLISSPAR